MQKVYEPLVYIHFMEMDQTWPFVWYIGRCTIWYMLEWSAFGVIPRVLQLFNSLLQFPQLLTPHHAMENLIRQMFV